MGRRATGTGPRRNSSSGVRQKLQSGWKEFTDASSGDLYYWNEATDVTSWERPSEGIDETKPHKDDPLSPAKKIGLVLEIGDSSLPLLESYTPGFCSAWKELLLTTTTNLPRRIELRTRLQDWHDGGLSAQFFTRRVMEMRSRYLPLEEGMSAEEVAPSTHDTAPVCPSYFLAPSPSLSVALFAPE